MVHLSKRLQKLDLAKSKTPGYYRTEAHNVLRQYNTVNPNFKYFIYELIEQAGILIPAGDRNELITKLQKLPIKNVQTNYNILKSKIKYDNKYYRFINTEDFN